MTVFALFSMPSHFGSLIFWSLAGVSRKTLHLCINKPLTKCNVIKSVLHESAIIISSTYLYFLGNTMNVQSNYILYSRVPNKRTGLLLENGKNHTYTYLSGTVNTLINFLQKVPPIHLFQHIRLFYFGKNGPLFLREKTNSLTYTFIQKCCLFGTIETTNLINCSQCIQFFGSLGFMSVYNT